MPIEIAEHAGFCMGVRRAVTEAIKAAEEESGTSPSASSHNPEVIRHWKGWRSRRRLVSRGHGAHAIIAATAWGRILRALEAKES